MAENDDEFEENDEASETPKDLRKQLAATKKAQKALEDELTELRAERRTRTVAELLSTKGLSPKVAKLLPASIDVNDSTAIDTWLAEYADVFGAPSTEDATTSEGDQIDDETKAAHQRVANATAGASHAGTAADLLSKINDFTDPEALKAFLATAQ